MIKYLSSFVIFPFIYWANPSFAECEKLAYGSKKGTEIISIVEIKNTSELKYSTFDIALPEKVQKFELVWIALIKGCIQSISEYINIPLRTYKENSKILTQVTIRSDDPSEWYIKATYLPPQEEGMIMNDGPAIESWEKLKHNKAPK